MLNALTGSAKKASHTVIFLTTKQTAYPPAPTSKMSSARKPYFIIVGLSVDAMAQEELEIERHFQVTLEQALVDLEKMKKSLVDNGFDHDCKFSKDAQMSYPGIAS